MSDIIRQEFADRLVFTDEENKRIKNEISELKARQRIELDKAKEQIEDIKRQKDDEMEEVHKRYSNLYIEYGQISPLYICIIQNVLDKWVLLVSHYLHCVW